LGKQSAPSPVLAGSAGPYREQPPSKLLCVHFQCVWSSLIPHGQVAPVVVMPDGCVDLLWRDDRLLVAGPDVTAAHPNLTPGTTVLGIRFQPGAARNWLGLPMSEIVGREVNLADLWGRRAHDFSAMMSEAVTIDQQAALLQALLSRVLPTVAPPARDAATVFHLLRHNTGSADNQIVSLLARLEVSERTLRRRCHDHFGYGPKTLDRILRLQRFLALARTSRHGGLAALAFESGYADQAHLGRDIQALCGMTAGTLVRQIAA